MRVRVQRGLKNLHLQSFRKRESSPEPNEVSYGAIEDSPALAHYKGLQARETSSEISKRGFDDERFPSWYLSVIIPPRLVVYVYHAQIRNGQPAILDNHDDDDVLADDDLLANQAEPDQQDPEVANVDYHHIDHNHDNHQDHGDGQPDANGDDLLDDPDQQDPEAYENQAHGDAIPAAPPLPPHGIANPAAGYDHQDDHDQSEDEGNDHDQSEDEGNDHDDENQAHGNANAAAPPLPPRGDPDCPLRPLLPRNYHEPRNIHVFRGGRRGRGGGRRGGRGVPGNVHQGEHVPLVDDANVANQQEHQVGGNVHNDNHDQQEDGGNDHNDANEAHANANPAAPPLPPHAPVPAPVPQVDDAPVPAPVSQVDDVPPPPPPLPLKFLRYNTTRRLEQDHCQNPEME
ncbi:hypothetical protein F2Q70_00025075 [Brassica cretica]|uniref:Uncharacterized protein n=1 Tax=Brassica cretica TaxID=69181 RepID=A0A8S9L4G9_BRACR|nr:hypothetical protein F2Q70_00025075 [Brassica cretica]